MNISGLLGTFASSLRFYISEFERIILHVSGNLPVVSNQIEAHVSEARKLLDSQQDNFKDFTALLDIMLSVKTPIYEILVEIQKQDIIQQQMNHLLDAVGDVQKIIDENESLLEKFTKNKKVEDRKEEFKHLFTLLSFLLNSIEKQMSRINKDLMELVDIMEQKFSDIHTKISLIHNDKKSLSDQKKQLRKNIQSVLNITENLSNELNQYNSFFVRLRLLQDDMKREIAICTNLKVTVEEDLHILGGSLSLKECKFSNTIIQKIVEKLSVDEERQTLKKEYSELVIEDSSDSDVTFF